MSATLGISVAAGALHAIVVRNDRVLWAARADYQDHADLGAAIARLSAERPRGIKRARVALAGSLAQVRTIENLPRLSRRELADHLRLSGRQYLLQNGSRLISGAAPWSPNRKSAPGSILLAAAQESLIETLVTGLDAAGLRADDIAPAQLWLLDCLDRAVNLTEPLGAEGPEFLAATAAAIGSAPPIALLPIALVEKRAHLQRRAALRWAMASAASVAIALASYFGALRRSVRQTHDEMARLSAPLTAALATGRDLDQARQALAFFDTGPGRRSGNARLLAAMSRALPDSAFVTSFRRDRRGRVTIAAFAPRAAAVAAALERADTSLRVRLDGAITREIIGSQEYDRFTLVLAPRDGARP